MTINQTSVATHNGVRSTFVEVNLSPLGRNLQAIREKVSPAKVLIVIKANAYWHGLAEWAGTIPYEILTNIYTHAPRVFVTD